MHEVTRILSIIDQDPQAAEQLLPLVYDELRRLAAEMMAQERPGQTLPPTALVHEAYLRLVQVKEAQNWESRRHFFAAAAEAMRRILVERARKRCRHEAIRGRQVSLDELTCVSEFPTELVPQLDDALRRLETRNATAAELVKLRFFVGLTMPQAAEALGLPLRSAERTWTYVRTWLHRELEEASI